MEKRTCLESFVIFAFVLLYRKDISERLFIVWNIRIHLQEHQLEYRFCRMDIPYNRKFDNLVNLSWKTAH